MSFVWIVDLPDRIRSREIGVINGYFAHTLVHNIFGSLGALQTKFGPASHQRFRKVGELCHFRRKIKSKKRISDEKATRTSPASLFSLTVGVRFLSRER